MTRCLHLENGSSLHLTYLSEWTALTSDLLVRKEIALTSDHVGTNPTVTSEWPALISDMEGTNPLTMTERLSPYI